MRFSSFLRLAVFLALSTLPLSRAGSTLLSRENTYSPKSEDEVEALSVVVFEEIGANNATEDHSICFSVDGLRPSPQFVESLRQQNVNVCNSKEQREKSDRSIDLRLENVESDLPKNIITVRSKVFALRAKESQDNLVMLEDGDYVMEKVAKGLWWIKKYVNRWQPGIAAPSGGWFREDCTGASFNMDKIEGTPGERVFLRLETNGRWG
jgi:hypothetical protein